MFSLVSLALGIFLLIIYIAFSFKGLKYESYIESLDDSEYPLKEFYVLGLGLNDTKLFALRGKAKYALVGNARLLYEDRYAEFYATIAWAQTLTFIHISLCLGFLFAALLNATLFSFIGIACAGIFGYYFFSSMKGKVASRRAECLEELPEIVSTMALLINSGMTLRETWGVIAESKEGKIYQLMSDALVEMNNGVSDVDAIHKFGILTDSSDIKKFTSSLVQGIEKGSKDLSDLLAAQSSEMWNLKKQIMLQKGEAAASKLLLPIALIFLGIMVIVISGAIGMLI